MKKHLASTFALSAAALFLGACGKDKPTTSAPDGATPIATDKADPAPAADPNAKQRCYGVNSCAGETACDVTGKWDCGGKNDCCGKGWLHLTKAECDAKGGSDDEAILANPPAQCPDKPVEGAGDKTGV